MIVARPVACPQCETLQNITAMVPSAYAAALPWICIGCGRLSFFRHPKARAA